MLVRLASPHPCVPVSTEAAPGMRPQPGAEPLNRPGRTKPPSVGKEGVAPMRHRHVRADGGGAERLVADEAVFVAFACDGFIRGLSAAQHEPGQRAAQLGTVNLARERARP